MDFLPDIVEDKLFIQNDGIVKKYWIILDLEIPLWGKDSVQ